VIYGLGSVPQLGQDCFVADNATLVGEVTLGDRCSIWFNAVLRGDIEAIHIGDETNIQDASVLHTDEGFPLQLGHRVTVGHKAMLHGCSIADGSLVGINAVVLNGVKIGRDCLIGANALVTEGKIIPDRSLVLGSPGRVVRSLSGADVTMLRESARHYVEIAERYLRELQRGLDR
jgi:carbonic anhydrase/acetyltransferase-like protein (isoleucine patch superfamily)